MLVQIRIPLIRIFTLGLAMTSLGCTEGIPNFPSLGKSLKAPQLSQSDRSYTLLELDQTLVLEGSCDPRVTEILIRTETGPWQEVKDLITSEGQANCQSSQLKLHIPRAGEWAGFTEVERGQSKELHLRFQSPVLEPVETKLWLNLAEDSSPPAPPPPPESVSLGDVNFSLSQSPTLFWSGADNAHTEVQLLKSRDHSTVKDWEIASTGHQTSGLNLILGENYYFKLRSRRGGGGGEGPITYSEVVTSPSWTALAEMPCANSEIRSLLRFENTLYLSGYFTHLGPCSGGGLKIQKDTGQLVKPLKDQPKVDGIVMTSLADGSGGECLLAADFPPLGVSLGRTSPTSMPLARSLLGAREQIMMSEPLPFITACFT